MLGVVAMAPGARNISVPLLSDRADLTVAISFDLLEPVARRYDACSPRTQGLGVVMCLRKDQIYSTSRITIYTN